VKLHAAAEEAPKVSVAIVVRATFVTGVIGKVVVGLASIPLATAERYEDMREETFDTVKDAEDAEMDGVQPVGSGDAEVTGFPPATTEEEGCGVAEADYRKVSLTSSSVRLVRGEPLFAPRRSRLSNYDPNPTVKLAALAKLKKDGCPSH
jgi:hypothetical protein